MRNVPERSCGRHEFHVKREARDNPSAKNETKTGAEMTAVQDANEGQWAKWRSVADLYHAFFTGLILTVVARRGTADAAEFVFRVFRRQQQERFLPGLEKLGLGSSAAGGGGSAVSLSLQLDRRRPCRIHVRDRPQGLDPLSAAALDLARHRDLRRARRSLARDAARLARQQRRGARQSKTRLRLHQAERRRAGRPRRLLSANTIIRSSSISGWCSRGISKRRCSIRPTAPALAGRELAEAAAGKSLSQLRDGICEDRCTRDGASVRT